MSSPCRVNLSAKSITDPNLPSQIARALEDAGADGRGLCIEVTETAAIVNVDRAKSFASAVAALGCELSLDDFGAGFASFYYLKHLTFDVLKIDGEFVRDLTTSHMNQLLVKSVVDIAAGLASARSPSSWATRPRWRCCATWAWTSPRASTWASLSRWRRRGCVPTSRRAPSGSNPARS